MPLPLALTSLMPSIFNSSSASHPSHKFAMPSYPSAPLLLPSPLVYALHLCSLCSTCFCPPPLYFTCIRLLRWSRTILRAVFSIPSLSLSPPHDLPKTTTFLPSSLPLLSFSHPFLVIFLQPLSTADLAFLVLHPDPRQIPNLQKGLQMLSEGMSRVEKSGGGMSPFLFRLLSTTYVTLRTSNHIANFFFLSSSFIFSDCITEMWTVVWNVSCHAR